MELMASANIDPNIRELAPLPGEERSPDRARHVTTPHHHHHGGGGGHHHHNPHHHYYTNAAPRGGIATTRRYPQV